MPTVTSETAVANLALQHLGERSILDIGDSGEKASVELRKAFVLTRQTLLREHYFNFSEDVVALQRLETAPVARFDYAYQLPSDCLRAIAINDDEEETQDDFELASEGRLFTNADTVNLRYIKDVETVTRWDAAFVDAMALKLAVKTCKTITGSDERVESLTRAFQGLSLPSAKAADSREGRPEQPWHYRESRLVQSRRSSNIG